MQELKCVFSWFPKAGFNILYMKMHQPNLKNHNCFTLCHIVFKFLDDMHKGHRFQLNILNVSSLPVRVVSFKAFFKQRNTSQSWQQYTVLFCFCILNKQNIISGSYTSWFLVSLSSKSLSYKAGIVFSDECYPSIHLFCSYMSFLPRKSHTWINSVVYFLLSAFK
jgi:hypothetical protein